MKTGVVIAITARITTLVPSTLPNFLRVFDLGRIKWTRRESNPCPKHNPLSFYECSLFFGSGHVRIREHDRSSRQRNSLREDRSSFPLPAENKHPSGFSSFIIRPHAQSFACVVSHIVEAWVLKCECSRSDCCN